MTNKEYLQQYELYRNKIREAKDSLLGLVESIDALSVDYSGMPHGSGISNKPERYVISLEQAVFERQTDIENYHTKMKEIEDSIMRIDNPMYSRVLWLKYVKGYTWDEIADDKYVMLSSDHVRSRLHGRALQQIKQPQ